MRGGWQSSAFARSILHPNVGSDRTGVIVWMGAKPREDRVTVLGVEHLEQLLLGRVHDAKMVFNERGAIVFPVRQQHRDMKAEGISYEDNYDGNALAAMLRAGAIEIRFHRAFDDRAVARIVGRLLALPEFSCMARATVTYQGRVVTI